MNRSSSRSRVRQAVARGCRLARSGGRVGLSAVRPGARTRPCALVNSTATRLLTAVGRGVAVLLTKAHGRVLAPGLTALNPTLPPDLAKRHPLATAWRTLDRELD